MSFLDKLKEKAGVAAQTASGVANVAVNKTKTMASIGRVKLAISQEEDKLKKAYTELGRLFYRDHMAGMEADMTEYQPWCDRAEEARAKIQSLTEELEALKAQEQAPEPVEAEDAAIAEEGEEAPSEPQEAQEAAEEEAPEDAPQEPQEPPIGTLYVDTTGQDE